MSGASSEFSKYSATRWKVGGRAVHQLEQLRAGLLLGRIDVLVALHDIEIDRQPLLPLGQRRVPFRDRLVALRTQIPDGRRILNQEGE